MYIYSIHIFSFIGWWMLQMLYVCQSYHFTHFTEQLCGTKNVTALRFFTIKTNEKSCNKCIWLTYLYKSFKNIIFKRLIIFPFLLFSYLLSFPARKPQEIPQNQLIWTHRVSQTLICQPEILHGSDVGSLQVCYKWVAWCSCRTFF